MGAISVLAAGGVGLISALFVVYGLGTGWATGLMIYFATGVATLAAMIGPILRRVEIGDAQGDQIEAWREELGYREPSQVNVQSSDHDRSQNSRAA